MSLWECITCGCKAIAHDLGFCPQCFQPKGDEVPKISVELGASHEADEVREEVPVAPAEQPADESQADQETAQEAPATGEAAKASKSALDELEAAAESLKRPAKARQDG